MADADARLARGFFAAFGFDEAVIAALENQAREGRFFLPELAGLRRVSEREWRAVVSGRAPFDLRCAGEGKPS